MSTLLEFWDRVELDLVTLPFVVQIVVLLTVGIPLFALAAVAVHWFADLIVRVARAPVHRADRTAGRGLEEVS